MLTTQVALDGFFTDMNGDMSWAHKDDAEWKAFVADNASGGGQLIFGRITYELMAGYWPTPYAIQNDPNCFAIGAGGVDRRIPDRGEPRRSWQGEDDVRRRQREAGPEADKDAALRQWECLAVLRTDGVKFSIPNRCLSPAILIRRTETGSAA